MSLGEGIHARAHSEIRRVLLATMQHDQKWALAIWLMIGNVKFVRARTRLAGKRPGKELCPINNLWFD
jgi:hypothetical protein